MNQSRLNSLALQYIHKNRRINLEEVVITTSLNEYLKGKHRF
jgi:hypothetical protein